MKNTYLHIIILLLLLFFVVSPQCSRVNKEDLSIIRKSIINDYLTGGNDGSTKDNVKDYDDDDFKIVIESAEASSTWKEETIERSFDGKYNTRYSSKRLSSGSALQLTYYFKEVSTIDYLIYIPLIGPTNGFFGNTELWYSTDGTNFVNAKDVDFKELSIPTTVNFDKSLAGVKAFRFIVKSAKERFAGCAEMEFYTKNPNKVDPLTLFTDSTCSEIKPGLTDEEIQKCPNPLYKNIAISLKQGNYPKAFRIQEYRAWPDPGLQATINKTNPYSLHDNPTGISVEKGERLIVFVGDIYERNIRLMIQNLNVTAKGDTYLLRKGVNKITTQSEGLVYIYYFASDYETAPPIKIHFGSGKVNGYFDSTKHEPWEWEKRLGEAVDKHFDVLGKYAHLTFPTEQFRNYASTSGKELIDAYDLIVKSQMEFLGLYKYNKVFKNRAYFHVFYGAEGHMYATNNLTAYNNDALPNIVDVQKLKTTRIWGPAHEMGHINQTRPGLRWVGTTEVTNNIMSAYTQTTIMGQPCRLQVESSGNNKGNRYAEAWTNLVAKDGEAPHAKENHFSRLVPFWQLELYYGKVLGRTPTKQADKGGFYPDVYEHIRTNPDLKTAGKQQIEFVYIASLVAKANLLDFFEKWGFLTPIDIPEVVDYSRKERFLITQTDINEIKRRVNALGFEKPDVALEYISDNTVDLYKTKPRVITGTSRRSGATFTMNGWKNVVVYEVVDESGKKVCISDGVLEPSDTATFTMNNVTWKEGFKVYAVSASGDRTEVTFSP